MERYFEPIDKAMDPLHKELGLPNPYGSLYKQVPSSSIVEANKAVEKAIKD